MKKIKEKNKLIKILKQTICHHDWEIYNVLIYNLDIEPKSNLSEIKKHWLIEVREYMSLIGLEGILPYFFNECKKCSKQTIPAIDTLIKATITDWYIPEYVWNEEDYVYSDNRYPMEILDL